MTSHVVQVLDDVSRQALFDLDERLDDLVEAVGVQLEDVDDPGKGAATEEK